ncbi:riboflavin kinase [Peribacillus asahii]|uniref:riboflavin kinase n=1 Tax=Peribacillus asahii TaxID=228899 RepID=UPI003805A281
MPYTSIVVHGRKLGREIGFPTANLEPTSQFFSLEKGVYTVLVQHESNKYMGVMNIGQRPTVSKNNILAKGLLNDEQLYEDMTIEVHILNFDKEIYGHSLGIEPLSYIREEKKFNSLEELKVKISRDIQIARATFSERGLINDVS